MGFIFRCDSGRKSVAGRKGRIRFDISKVEEMHTLIPKRVFAVAAHRSNTQGVSRQFYDNSEPVTRALTEIDRFAHFVSFVQ